VMSTVQIFRQNNTYIYIISHACCMPSQICSQFEHLDGICLPCLLRSKFWRHFSRAIIAECKLSPAHRFEIFPSNLQGIRIRTVSFASNIITTIRCPKRSGLTSSNLWDAQKTLKFSTHMLYLVLWRDTTF
jgi:hypothetical protein